MPTNSINCLIWQKKNKKGKGKEVMSLQSALPDGLSTALNQKDKVKRL